MEVSELDRSPTSRALLGYLILHRGQTLGRSKVAGLFWPDVPEAQARRALNTQLWRLHRIAEGILVANLQATTHTLRWDLPADAWLDVEEFEALTKVAAGADVDASTINHETLAALERAVFLYRGALLEDCDAEWCELPRLRYQERYAHVLETLIAACEQRDMFERALHHAEALSRIEPYRESGHAAVIRLRRALNRRQAALAAYQHYAQLWQDELGLSPSEHIQRLLPSHTETTSSERVSGALARVLTSLSGAASPAEISAMLSTTQQADPGASLALADQAERIGGEAEDEQVWEVARQAYETALSALAGLPPDSACLRRQLALRLKCDPLYDRAASLQAQSDNLAQAFDLAEKLGDAAAQSEISARQCWVAQSQGRLQASARFGQTALSLAGDNAQLRAQALRLLGTSHELLGEYSTAVDCLQHALHLDVGKPELLRLDHNRLASVYTSLACDWKALEHIQTALALTPDRPPSRVRAYVLGNLSNIQRELGDFTEAMINLRHAQAFAGMLGDREAETWLAARASVLYRQTGDFSRAQLWAVRAWRLSHEIARPRFSVEAALELARLAGRQGLFAEAQAWIDRADEMAKASAASRYRGVIDLVQGLLFHSTGRLDAAASTTAAARKALCDSRENRFLALCHTVSAEIAHRLGDARLAWQHLEQARDTLLERAGRIPDAAVRTRFLNALPFRRQLHQGAKLPELETLWLV